ncbi:hypothetical protein [Boseongicola aestuarii]|jgi:hypothetical protein|uniref:Uncharacterized protein n=1 Tax=Boseongicola aestuarii TaxID=1470561 RepID=A0A238IVY0_9RHOB|nr:hypothetical protein [Boseongicola aestuarii]SMX22567.1 hypothetical protein BOA8489_00664 [Boseongicola aestuarii]
MLVNVIDLREREYRWSRVMAVLESATKNNDAEEADQVKPGLGVEIDYAERTGLSVREAMLWAEKTDGPLTLYLYDDEGEDTDADG